MMAELAEKMATFSETESPVSPRQRSVSHLSDCHGENPRNKFLKLLNHPPYSPDEAPSDFFLFPHLKLRSEDRDFRQIKRQSTS
ncbi:hypothetical protein TNCV_922941 [Trichonephila clavipes]|nr:hypothetical protein TNCV_922941 [Trichonephila clavipes]